MESNAEHRRSTLAYLRPGAPFVNTYKRSTSSMRYQGSFRLNLARATRLPDNSREYRSGDQLNLIDWRAYARSNQLVVREVHDEASVTVRIIIDARQSMRWPNDDLKEQLGYQGPSKLEIAVRAGLFCSFFHARNGDQIEIWLETDDSARLCLSCKTAADISSTFSAFEKAKFDVKEILNYCHSRKTAKESCDILYLFSDGLSTSHNINVFGRAKQKYWLHTLSELEINSSWMQNGVCYFDLEMDSKEFLGENLIEEKKYDKAVKAWLNNQRENARKERVDYLLITPKSSIDSFTLFLQSHKRKLPGGN